MDFTYDQLGSLASGDAYSRLLEDSCMLGDSTLFTRSDAVEMSWRFFDPILRLWKDEDFPLYGYPAGTWGWPKQSDDIIERDHSWTNPAATSPTPSSTANYDHQPLRYARGRRPRRSQEAFVRPSERGWAHIAVSGGSTPRLLFELLAEEPLRSAVRWDKVHLYWVDERCVPPTDPESNYGMAKAALLDHVPIPEDQVHRIAGRTTPSVRPRTTPGSSGRSCPSMGELSRLRCHHPRPRG